MHPSVINAKQWEWMKRYRVWEANRKIFLFPENWLEPEFRDDKTHLFAELEGALLQGDVSSDLVEDAFLNYLKKLDELARLDIVAMHLEDNADPGPAHPARHRPHLQPAAQVLLPPLRPPDVDALGAGERRDRGRPPGAGGLARSAVSVLGDVPGKAGTDCREPLHPGSSAVSRRRWTELEGFEVDEEHHVPK